MVFRPEMHSGEMPLGYDKLNDFVVALANKISQSYAPDTIVAIARGGLVPAVILSHLLGDVPLIPIALSYYDGALRWAQVLPADGIRGRRVLIVDDITVRGGTLAAVYDKCLAYSATDVKTAVMILHPSAPGADFYAVITDAKPLFPWDGISV